MYVYMYVYMYIYNMSAPILLKAIGQFQYRKKVKSSQIYK